LLEEFDRLSYLAKHPAARTIFESKVVVEDKNTQAPAAAAKAGGCVPGATEPFQGFPAVESLALHKRVNAAGAIRQSATQKDPIPGICVLQGLAEEPLADTT